MSVCLPTLHVSTCAWQEVKSARLWYTLHAMSEKVSSQNPSTGFRPLSHSPWGAQKACCSITEVQALNLQPLRITEGLLQQFKGFCASVTGLVTTIIMTEDFV